MLLPDTAPLLYQEVEKIATHPEWTPSEQVLALSALLERIFVEATRREQLMFSTLFARISYAGHLFNIQAETLRDIHLFRRAAARVRLGQIPMPQDLTLGIKALAESVLVLTHVAIPASLFHRWIDLPAFGSGATRHGVLEYAASLRVTALRDHPQDQYLEAIDETQPDQPLRIRYGLPERNENFNPTIQIIRRVFGFPVPLQLLEVEIDAAGYYCPRIFIVEPDYLMDVSAIAECFKDTGLEPYTYLARKFLPYEFSDSILLGNIANHFLDRLLHEPDAGWQTLFRETFQLYPFHYAAMSDKMVKDIAQKSQRHFLHLKEMATGGFAKQGIEPEHCVLEPTFFSELYGLQGRLDLFYRTETQAAIVELKSGRPYKPNSYGISRSHFTQTLLYDLLVRSVFGRLTDPAKYILYSGEDLNPLRFAPTVAPEQWESLQLRNQLVAIERLLTAIRPGDEQVPVLNRLRAVHGAGKGFVQRDYAQFEAPYSGLNLLERKYFNAYTGFIAREHWMAKVGEEGSENYSGLAALWRSDFKEKQANFSMLSHLEMVENRADQPEATLVFRKTEHTNPLANFRVGDIAVLYPALEESDTILQHQVIKCTIVELGKTQVSVQLRYRQFNLNPFETEGLWQLEPDFMDIGFAGMYRSLLEWAGAERSRRALLLAAAPPPPPLVSPAPETAGMTPEQHAVFHQMIASQGYFLLWGPPGTGKTSVMLRALVDWVLHHTSDNLLLLAYTNRAVDEICEAIDSLGGDIRAQYLRIGSRHAASERTRDQLLSVRVAALQTRAELHALLDSKRIFVSTVASFSQNDPLLRIKKIQRLVVDEASQILEPQLIGLLTRFEHFTLIGDHRQLPAVTTQRPEMTIVQDDDLHSIGLSDLRDSYFERLYRRCASENWHWALGRLSYQGRMHADIMDFPNRYFYDGFLQTLSGLSAAPETHYQQRTLAYEGGEPDTDLEAALQKRRVIFLSTQGDLGVPGQKTNKHEADQAAQLVLFFKKLFEKQGKTWHPAQSLGIITPWRAQIAQIRSSLAALGLDPEEVTVDTVERYQGGAREIILLSTCVNSEYQLAGLISLSGEQIDRKLNVALTRARQHVIVLGNATLLRKDERYRNFIEQYSVGTGMK